MADRRPLVWRRIAGALLAVSLLACDGSAADTRPSAIPEVAASELPAQARETIALIRKGGPFPYRRDGVVFGNIEKRLPIQGRGYYREYTVRTPGAKDRGARRIVAGRGGELYYTDDHYNSFQRIKEP
ncbi:MAG TPA: ribonuclease domain-containing protein [Burkholderiales bacterium]|nr:ribonuclease domain-containing protein [Burkholderiales bacterium]